VSALDPVLVLRDLHKSFGGTPIIRGVDLAVKRGQRHALIGPNGAGKSTLFNLISGHYVPSAGEILLNGRSVVGLTPYAINRRGLSRSFQITNLFPRMSVAENLRIAVMGHHGHRFTLFRPVANLRRVSSRVDEHLEKLRLQHRRNDMAGDLAYSEQRALEIGMALAANPKLLLLDEPTAGMSPEETKVMMVLIRKLVEQRTVVLVEHKMKMVMGISERIVVLHHGELLAEGTPDDIRSDEMVKRVYLGQGQH